MLRKFMLAAAMALTIAGCASIQNPVNTTKLATVESGYGVALSIAVAYRNLPLCRTGTQVSISNICAKRSVVVKLQSADRQAQIALVAARTFVKNNPTLDASSVVSAAQIAVDAFRQVESTNGVQ